MHQHAMLTWTVAKAATPGYQSASGLLSLRNVEWQNNTADSLPLFDAHRHLHGLMGQPMGWPGAGLGPVQR
jgi:hypothetical protein